MTRRDGGGAGHLGLRFPDLLVAAQGGDEQAFAELWRDLQPAVLRYLQVAAAEAAEDLAADTWIAVIGGLGRFRGDERAFRAWVSTVARHRAIDWRRQARRRPTSVQTQLLTDLPAPDDPVAAMLEGQRSESWPIGACGGWPGGWRRPGWHGA